MARKPLTRAGVARPALLACGSRTAWLEREAECRAAHLPIVTLEHQTLDLETLDRQQVVVVAVGNLNRPAGRAGGMLAEFADKAVAVLKRWPVATLLVEGGATAAAISERMGWGRFAVCEPGIGGVGFLQPISDQAAPRVLMKPGSYPWPREIWNELVDLRREK